MNVIYPIIGIVGTGAMGKGIAQIAAQAGSKVLLLDTQPNTAHAAKTSIMDQWQKLLAKDRVNAEQVRLWSSELVVADQLSNLKPANLIIEAIVEKLEIKQAFFAELEKLTSTQTVFASNTSSLSITSIAARLNHPERFAGFHFFNPVPLMKVVEVVAGLKTQAKICANLMAYAKQLGHTAVMAQDTPGFIVNHAGRGFGTEALRIISESVSNFATVDRILKDQVGFKLGPFELMDLTALDVSHPVMESIYQQYYQEPRYRPSYITAQRLAGGVIGKKVGAGFYAYSNCVAQTEPEPSTPQVDVIPPVWVSSRAARRAQLYELLKKLGVTIETAAMPSPQALCLVAPLGFDITTIAVVEGLDPARTVGIDLLFDDQSTRRRVLATNPSTRLDMQQAAHALFAKDGKPVSVIKDSGGFVTQRVVAAIINIASDMCQQGICSPHDLDIAVMLGLGYPMGPLALGDLLGPANILEILFNLQTVYGDPRYRPSPWLKRRGVLALSLLHVES
jgi:3-hydroxybutyryl-CoA dehydrogenase